MDSILHYLSFLMEMVKDHPGNKVSIPVNDGWFFPIGDTQIDVSVTETHVHIEVKDAGSGN